MVVWGLTQPVIVFAQDEEESHRVLQLPAFASDDIATQFKAMRMFQEKVDGAGTEASMPPGWLDSLDLESLLPDDLSPEAQSALQDLLASGALDGLSPQSLAGDLSEPGRVEELLKQFGDTKQMPQILGGNADFEPPSIPGANDGSQSGLRGYDPSGESISQLRDAAADYLRRNQADSLPDMNEFFRDSVQESELPDLPDIERIVKQASQARQANAESQVRQKSNANKAKEAIDSWVPERVANGLRRRGIQSTFKEMLADVKKEAKEGGSSPGASTESGRESGARGVERSVLESLGGVTDSLMEVLGSLPKGKTGGANRGTGPSGDALADASGAVNGNQSGPNTAKPAKLEKEASGLFAKWFSAPDSSSSSAVATDSFDSGMPVSSGMKLELLVVLLAVAGACWYVIRLRRNGEVQVRKSRKPQLPTTINDTNDLVTIFHRLVNQNAATKLWWNHKLAADRFELAQPELQELCRALVPLYEQARYAPDVQVLSTDQLALAQAALEKSRAST